MVQLMKIDPVVKKETVYIAVIVTILSLLMESVFLIIGKWEVAVLIGNLLGGVAAVGNFLLMGITVQKAVAAKKKEAKSLMKVSQTLRMLMLFVVVLVGYLVESINLVAVVIPLLFPRVAIMLRPFIIKEKTEDGIK